MPATRCTCLRDQGVHLIQGDPACTAPSHLYDEIEAEG